MQQLHQTRQMPWEINVPLQLPRLDLHVPLLDLLHGPTLDLLHIPTWDLLQGPNISDQPPLFTQPLQLQIDESPKLHTESKAMRRGPMDEMRQLVRILKATFPQSQSAGRAVDCNSMNKADIIEYLLKLLGNDAPTPEWGLPDGWIAYLSQLLTWGSGKEVPREDISNMLQHNRGSSWQVVPEVANESGLMLDQWPMPFASARIRAVIHYGNKQKRAKMTELQLWETMASCADALGLHGKHGSTPIRDLKALQQMHAKVLRACTSFALPEEESVGVGK
jgi:hypothetical protein